MGLIALVEEPNQFFPYLVADYHVFAPLNLQGDSGQRDHANASSIYEINLHDQWNCREQVESHRYLTNIAKKLMQGEQRES